MRRQNQRKTKANPFKGVPWERQKWKEYHVRMVRLIAEGFEPYGVCGMRGTGS